MRLPTYERQVPVAGKSGSVRGDVQAAGAAAGGMAAFGAQATRTAGALLEQAMDAAERQRERAAAVEGAKVYAQTGADWTERMIRAQEEAPEGAPEFTGTVLKQFDEDAQQRLAAAPELARPWLETRFAALRGELAEKAFTFEAGARLAKQSRDLQGIVDLHANRVRSDFDGLQDAVGAAEGAIEASSLAGSAKVQAREAARRAIVVAGLQGLNERAPDTARRLLEDGRFDGVLRPEDKNKLTNDNWVEMRRRQAEAEQRAHQSRMELRAQLGDVEARLLDGRSTDYDGDRIRAVLGREEGDRVVAQLEEAAALGRDRVALAWASPEEAEIIIGDRRREVETGPVDGYADRAKRLSAIETVWMQRNREIAQDPAAYVMRAAPVREAFEALQAAPAGQSAAATERFVGAVLAEQERLGVPPTARRVLTSGQAKELVAQVTVPAEDGRSAGELVIGLADQYGRQWPRVLAELQEAGLPEGAAVVGAMDAREQRPAAIALAEAQQVGTAKLKDATGADAARYVDAALPDALADFEETVRNAPGGARLVSSYRDATRDLALSYVLQGADPLAATRRAAREIVLDRYEFRGGLRIPKGIDADAVEDAAAAALDGLEAVEPPPSENPRMSPEQVAAAYLRQVRARGRWATNADETGLLLLDEQGYVVMRPDGRPVELLFGDAP